MPSDFAKRRAEIEAWLDSYGPLSNLYEEQSMFRECLAEIDRLTALVAIAGEPEPPMQPARTFGSTVAAVIAAQENIE